MLTLSLNDGGTATYMGGSGSNALTFTYTVGASDATVSALAITGVNLPNGAAVTDMAGNPANLAGALTTFSTAISTRPRRPLLRPSPRSRPTAARWVMVSPMTILLTLTGTATAGSTVKVYDGATLLGSATANSNGAWSYTTGSAVNGAHSLTATATDAVGTSAASTALTVTIDTIAPTTPVLTTKVATGSFAYLVGTSEPNSTVSIFDGISGALVVYSSCCG